MLLPIKKRTLKSFQFPVQNGWWSVWLARLVQCQKPEFTEARAKVDDVYLSNLGIRQSGLNENFTATELKSFHIQAALVAALLAVVVEAVFQVDCPGSSGVLARLALLA